MKFSKLILHLAVLFLCVPTVTRAQKPPLVPTKAMPPVASSGTPLVTVDGTVITEEQYRAELNGRSEDDAGVAALKKLVFETLVRQAAQKANLLATDADVKARMAAIRRRMPASLAAADANPAIMKRIVYDMQTDVSLENLRMQGITVTPTEVMKFYQANKTAFGLPPQVMATVVQTQTAARAKSAEALLKKNVSPKSIASHPGLKVSGVNGLTLNMNALPASRRQQISDSVLRMKSGQIRTFALTELSPPLFLTFRVNTAAPAHTPPLSEVRPQIERLLRLKKGHGPTAALARLYQSAQIKFDQPHYASFFADVAIYELPPKP